MRNSFWLLGVAAVMATLVSCNRNAKPEPAVYELDVYKTQEIIVEEADGGGMVRRTLPSRLIEIDGKNVLVFISQDSTLSYYDLETGKKMSGVESDLDKEKIVAPLGGKRKKQCPDACEGKLYDVNETVCPICKKELVYNNYLADNYIEDDYIPMWEKHKKWVSLTLNKKLLALELGVSFKFPQIVRWPFEKIVSLNNKAEIIRVNETLPQLSEEVSGKGTSIKENSVEWVVGI